MTKVSAKQCHAVAPRRHSHHIICGCHSRRIESEGSISDADRCRRVSQDFVADCECDIDGGSVAADREAGQHLSRQKCIVEQRFA